MELSAIAVLFLSVILWAYTDNIVPLGIPFAYLFFLLIYINWKTAYWIFLFTIPPSIQLYFMDDTMSLTLPDQPMMWGFLLLFIVLLARNPKLLPEWWLKDKLVLISILQLLCIVVAMAFSTVPFYSLKFFLAKTWLFACYMIMPVFIFKEKKDFVVAFKLLLFPMLGTVIVIMVHHAMLGFRFDKVQRSITNLYINHVDYSTVISQFFPLLIVAYPLTKGRSIVTRWLLLLIIILFGAAIGFSYARAAVIAVIFAIVIGIAIRIKLVNLVMPGFYAVLIMLLCYMIPNNKYLEFRPDYNKTYMHKDFTDHLIATFRGKDMSSMERLYRWIAAVRMSTDEPLTGYGPHGFVYNYKPYTVNSFKTYVSRNPEKSTTHNYYLYMLVEQGWPAMLLYALLIPLIFAKAQKVYHRFKDKFFRSVTIGLAMCIAAGFINNFFSELIETHKVGALFYIPIVLLVYLDHYSKKQENITSQVG